MAPFVVFSLSMRWCSQYVIAFMSLTIYQFISNCCMSLSCTEPTQSSSVVQCRDIDRALGSCNDKRSQERIRKMTLHETWRACFYRSMISKASVTAKSKMLGLRLRTAMQEMVSPLKRRQNRGVKLHIKSRALSVENLSFSDSVNVHRAFRLVCVAARLKCAVMC